MDWLATVTLPYTTGLPEDIAINTFAFHGLDGDPETEAAAIVEALTDFYTEVTSGDWIGRWISEVVDRSTDACTISVAAIEDLGPVPDVSPPLLTGAFTLGAPHASGGTGAVSLPLEVAIVASFRTAPGEASPARSRGRIYLGPLDIVALDQTGPYPLLASGVVEHIADTCLALATASILSGVAEWSVWTRAGAAVFPVTSGWVDNEPDTQRRRGVDATTRVTWTTGI